MAARSNGVVEPLAAVMLLHAGLWLREATIAQECETVAHVLTERGATLGVVRALHARSLASPDGPAIVIDRLHAAAAQVDANIAVAALRHVEARLAQDENAVDLAVRELGRAGLILPAPGGRDRCQRAPRARCGWPSPDRRW